MKRQIALFVALTLLVFGPALVAGQTPALPRSPAGPDLVGSLKATPGCLGVETARTSSGKQVIFAWFENKSAVLTWYYSDTHVALMRQLSGGSARPGGPLADVPDEGPVLAVASLTPNAGAQPGDLRAGFSQIAIELYRPLPGGIAAGGRFGPSSMKVPGLVDVAMPTPATPPGPGVIGRESAR
jgi:hypothetical protein